MNTSLMEYLVSPVTHQRFCIDSRFVERESNQIINGNLRVVNEDYMFPIVEGVPLLQPTGCIADYTQELYEILFGEEAKSILDNFYVKYGETQDLYTELQDYIKTKLGREGVLKAFKDYAQLPEQRRLDWWYKNKEEPMDENIVTVTQEALNSGCKYATKEYGQIRSKQCENMAQKWAEHLPQYAVLVAQTRPRVIVELGTGAGLGTWAILSKGLPGRLISIDIDYVCVKNAEGLAKSYSLVNKVDPIVANFWYLPFADSTIDVVCSHYGLDESREVPRILQEVSRILVKGGRFVSVSRRDPTVRMQSVLKDIGFSKDEMAKMAAITKLYPGPETLSDWAIDMGLELQDLVTISPSSSHERSIFVFKKL